MLRALLVVAINAVPLAGVLRGDWSEGTALVLYWAENLVGSVLVAARVALHSRWTKKRGHRGGLLGEFTAITLISTLAHGVFLLVFLLLAGREGPEQVRVDTADMVKGAGIMTAVLLASFAQDLVSLARWPFAAVRGMTARGILRVILLHFVLVIGIGAGAWLGLGRGPFLALAVMKTLYDLSGSITVRQRGEPPGPWHRRVMLPLFRWLAPGKDFDAYWAETVAVERTRLAADEEVIPH